MRLSVQLLIVLMALNALGSMFAGSGVADATDLTGPGENNQIDDLENETRDRPDFGGGGLATLFGFYSAAADWWNTIITFLTAGPAMFKSIGFPSWFIDPLTGIMYFFLTADLIYVATQRSL